MIKRGNDKDNASTVWLDLTWIIVYRHGNHISGRMLTKSTEKGYEDDRGAGGSWVFA